MILYSVYREDSARYVTYQLFKERQENPYLSHVDKFPTWPEQLRYILGQPYTYWYAGFDEQLCAYVGMCWVDQKQSGIYTLNRWQHLGYGTTMMHLLMRAHPEMPYTAYIHPENIASIRLHNKLGFVTQRVEPNGQLVLARQ